MQDYYEKQSVDGEPVIQNATMPSNISMLDFPGPDVAASYHPVQVMDKPQKEATEAPSHKNPTTETQVTEKTTEEGGGASGLEVLEALGVSVRPKTDKLQSAPPGNLGLEETLKNLSPKIRDFIDTMNNITFEVRHRE